MEKLINEYKLNKLFNIAKLSSYENPTNHWRVDYDANKIFNRMIISMLSFSNHTLYDNFRLFRIDQRSKIDKEIIDKWKEEMDSFNIKSDKNKMIKILNNYEPELDDLPIIKNPKDIMSEQTVNRMFEKFKNYSGGSWDEFEILANIIFMRYTTYDAWTQCWTLTPKDRKSVIKYKDNNYLNIELFGSPFNTQIDTYIFGSLFPDTDEPFGGIMRYENLYEYILDENDKGNYFNIQISPPNVLAIIDDLSGKILELKKQNKVLVMFPWWEDSQGFQEVEQMFGNRKDIYEYLDMFKNKIVKGSNRIHSVLFYDY